MLGLARSIVFFWVNGASAAEKSRLARAQSYRRDRFSVKSMSDCARSRTDGSRRLFLFFDDAVLVCFACAEKLCALELLS